MKRWIVAASMVLSGPASAQWAPGVQFGEPQVVVGDPAHTREPTDLDAVTEDPETLEPESATPQELAPPLDHEAIAVIHEQAAAATVPVYAVFPQDPLTWPPDVTLEGAATRIEISGRDPILLTALVLVDGASTVEISVDNRLVRANVRGDARYGLAVLEPAEPLAEGPALPVHAVVAGQVVEAFSSGPNTAGATVGAGEGVYGWYQRNTVGVTLGYPLVNRRGELVGVGSHRHPLDPTYTLSVPSGVVEDFLAALDAPE